MKSELFDLTGKVAVITGSYQGLGLAVARGLGQAGATLILNGRNEGKLRKGVSTLSGEGFKVLGSCFDISDAAQIREKILAVEREAGPIHILVNNAGIQRRSPLEQFEESVWREVLDTNLTGLFLVTKQVVQGMIARRGGKIINICSLMCEMGRPTVGAYTAAKGGVKMLTKAMAVEWGKHNIQVNGIGPGYFTTEMNRPLYEDPKFDAWIKGRTPMGRWGDPAELVGAAVFLASRASDFVSGQVIYVDGGILAAL
ncbi:MAG TPA: SDR family NAD(P)-dependent oxidoreductase [Candidatus Methylomirabilis sp.]|nr:SDR family NAD(P)-dependent oxidoreductase [Candidatus Methylomirabilis sp.]